MELRAPQGGVPHGRVESVAVDRRGRIIAVFSEAPSKVFVFEASGRYLTSLRLGDAQMRAASALTVAVDHSDSVYVADGWNQKIAVFDSTLREVRTGEFDAPGTIRGLARLSDGSFLVAADIRRAESVGLPLHSLTSGGKRVRSFGAPDTAFVESRFGAGTHVLAVGTDGGVWSSPELTFRLRRWNRESSSEQLEFKGGVPASWSRGARMLPWGVRIAPAIVDIHGSKCDRLWVVSHVPSDASWEEIGLDSSEIAPGSWRRSARYPERTFRTVIDLIDIRRGQYLASFPIAGSVRPMLSDSTALVTDRGPDGRWRTMLLRFQYRKGDKQFVMDACRD